MARKQNGSATRVQISDTLTESLGHQRVQPIGGLIKEVHIHIAGQRRDKGDLLPISFGVRGDLGAGVEVELRDEFVAALRAISPAHAPQGLDGLAAGQPWPQGHFGRNIRESPMEFLWLDPRIGTEETCGASVWLEQSEQDTQRGGFSCTVGPEEAVNATLIHMEGEPIEGTGGAEGFDDIVEIDHGAQYCSPTAPSVGG